MSKIKNKISKLYYKFRSPKSKEWRVKWHIETPEEYLERWRKQRIENDKTIKHFLAWGLRNRK